jgi:hypothetical protein
VRVNLAVVGDLSWQLTHYGFGIWSRTAADIVALDRTILPSHGCRSEPLLAKVALCQQMGTFETSADVRN